MKSEKRIRILRRLREKEAKEVCACCKTSIVLFCPWLENVYQAQISTETSPFPRRPGVHAGLDLSISLATQTRHVHADLPLSIGLDWKKEKEKEKER